MNFLKQIFIVCISCICMHASDEATKEYNNRLKAITKSLETATENGLDIQKQAMELTSANSQKKFLISEEEAKRICSEIVSPDFYEKAELKSFFNGQKTTTPRELDIRIMTGIAYYCYQCNPEKNVPEKADVVKYTIILNCLLLVKLIEAGTEVEE
ncbi:MAG: hypothetical protein HEEMFOPI_00485 [Holosporales bacterium]